MRSFVFFGFNFVILTLISMTGVSMGEGVTVENCGSNRYQISSSSRIVGGYRVIHGEYPWMASLQYHAASEFLLMCGAIVLNENWVLTAAHCVYEYGHIPKLRLLVGLRKLLQVYAKSVQRMQISRIVIHEDYDNSTKYNDIALLKTSTPINITGSKGYVNGICLPESGSNATGDATVIGWGLTQYGGDVSNILKGVSVPIISNAICSKGYKGYFVEGVDAVTDNTICAGSYRRDSCELDSGGPLFQRNGRGIATLIGILSFGKDCGQKDNPGVYTKVSSYIDWIQNIIQTDMHTTF